MSLPASEHSITIGQYNTWTSWGLIPSEVPTIAPFEPKYNYIDIPYFSRRFDFTEALQGSVPFGAAEGTWKFYVLNGNEALHQTIMAAIHGKQNTIVFEGVTYTGRVEVADWKNHGAPDYSYAECTLKYTLDPPSV